MRLLFASDYPHLPENTGGVEVNTHELCLALGAAGHQVAVMAQLLGRGLVGTVARAKLRSRLAGNFVVDRSLGYPVLRCWRPVEALHAAMEWFRPDVVVVQSWDFAMVAEALRHDVAAMLYSHSAHSAIEGVRTETLGRCVLVANSLFNARFQGGAVGVRFDVLHPLVNPDRCRCDGPRSHVVQVGLSPEKGAAVTLAVAEQRPDIPFLVVQTWEGLRQRPGADALRQKAATLANVRIIPPERDPRRLYRRARLLLAPSQWLETWGRVVTEVQISGIPVVASNRGGLPEAVGDGGVVVDWDAPTEAWVAAVARLWDEPDWYTEMGRRARARVAKDDVRPGSVLDGFMTLVRAAIARRVPAHASTAMVS